MIWRWSVSTRSRPCHSNCLALLLVTSILEAGLHSWLARFWHRNCRIQKCMTESRYGRRSGRKPQQLEKSSDKIAMFLGEVRHADPFPPLGIFYSLPMVQLSNCLSIGWDFKASALITSTRGAPTKLSQLRQFLVSWVQLAGTTRTTGLIGWWCSQIIITTSTNTINIMFESQWNCWFCRNFLAAKFRDESRKKSIS